MMRIAICEDNEHDVKLLTRLIEGLSAVPIPDRFISAESLLEAYASGKRYDLIFMDIQMPNMNGFEAAQIIHHEYHDDRPLIVFLTITDKYVFDAYNVGWDYICKPIDEKRIKKLYARARAELSHRTISLQTMDGFAVFKTRDILYIESYYGAVNIVTKQGTYQTRMTLEALRKELGNRPFCTVHRCYAVNLRHVTQHTQREVHMSNGQTVPLSRNYRKSFVESLENFHRGKCYG